ncbi:MAG: hypothetical protein F4Y22_09455 [Gammaproteobacteria bacterium]|nr:hypothetical protein [Gammaproteobacteria bacterium]MYA67463.1 hypothetical protein [Gammaproteobacteria bacterium]MYH46535.1 hypothetical protein [Gammaproteobacteria bacterium]MYL14781.1 hypothetical protein [Gammaproteobacteria bacterium]
MNISKWIDRIYSEKDTSRGIATAGAGIIGLGFYLIWNDGVIAAFLAVIVFPVIKILSSGISARIDEKRKKNKKIKKLREKFENLGHHEQQTVKAFVSHGGNTVTWADCNRSDLFSPIGIDSLVNRGLIWLSHNADCTREAFCLDEDLFEYARSITTDPSSN